MASIVSSANRSTASVLETIGTVADATNKLVFTASRAIDMLDAKIKTTHQSVIESATVDRVEHQTLMVMERSVDIIDRMEAVQRRVNADSQFNRIEQYNAIIQKISTAITPS